MTLFRKWMSNWIVVGLFWGWGMFIFYLIGMPLISGEPNMFFDPRHILFWAVLWTAMGLIFGYLVKPPYNKKETE